MGSGTQKPETRAENQTFLSGCQKNPKTLGKPYFFGTRTREMEPESDYCYPNPSLPLICLDFEECEKLLKACPLFDTHICEQKKILLIIR